MRCVSGGEEMEKFSRVFARRLGGLLSETSREQQKGLVCPRLQ